MSDNISFVSKEHRVVLQVAKSDDGYIFVEVWLDGSKMASAPIEYLYDFLQDAYLENMPTNGPNYLDSGRRFNQMLISNWLAPYLSEVSIKWR